MASEDDLESTLTSNETTSIQSDSGDHVKVCVRIRPLLKDEVVKNNDILAWTWEENSITLDTSKLYGAGARKSNAIGTNGRLNDDAGLNPAYNFDYLFKPENSNEYIFDTVVANVAEQAMCGFHGSGLKDHNSNYNIAIILTKVSLYDLKLW